MTVDEADELRIATFSVGDDLMALDIMRIKEIVRPLPVTPIPKAPPGMVGVVDLRGRVLPMFDLRLRFSLPPRGAEGIRRARQLMVSLDGRLLGLIVDEVHDVITVKRDALRLDATMLGGDASVFFLGVCPVPAASGERLALLLNLRRILRGAHEVPVEQFLTGSNPTLLPSMLSQAPTKIDRGGA